MINHLNHVGIRSSIRKSTSSFGGVVSMSDGYRIHKFTANDSFSINRATTIEFLLVGGGGGGGPGGNFGGGGGAGQVLTGSILIPAGTYGITVGKGGAGGLDLAGSAFGLDGTPSSFYSFNAIGGKGAIVSPTLTGGASGNGYAGGRSYGVNCGGGGGAGSGGPGLNGATGTYAGTGGAGGPGILLSISGSSVTYAGGGGGARGGKGQAGGGTCTANNGVNATPNSGSGGSGAVNATGGAGGSGIVIIRYLMA